MQVDLVTYFAFVWDDIKVVGKPKAGNCFNSWSLSLASDSDSAGELQTVTYVVLHKMTYWDLGHSGTCHMRSLWKLPDIEMFRRELVIWT